LELRVLEARSVVNEGADMEGEGRGGVVWFCAKLVWEETKVRLGKPGGN